MTKTKKWCTFALACSCTVALGAVGFGLMQTQADETKTVYGATITSELDGDTITLLSGEVADFALNYTKGSAINYAPKDGVATDRYVPKPATISWENSRDGALYYTLRVGLEEDLSDADSYLVSDTTLDVDYLFAAKHYYYQIYAHYDNDEVVKSQVFDFYTTDVPRTVYIEGVTNTRDLGGRYVQDGKYQIKQGMVYRGAEVNRELGAITEEGKRVMLHELGIKTDLDLRGGDVQNPTSTSPIDDSLNYIHVEAPWYTHITNASYKEALTTEFRTFANPDNYPIYLHCSVGRDRAGTLSFLLGALIGIEEIDLYRDYEMSFLSRVGLKDAAQSQGNHASLIGNVQNTFAYITNNYRADTLMESTERYVKEYLGLTQAEVDSIRNTLWEEVDDTTTKESVKTASSSRLDAPNAKVAKATTARDFLCTYSAVAKDEPEANYGSSAVNTYTAQEAAAKGIPAGYENEVFEVIPIGSSANCGVLLDFSAEKIPLGMIESLQFRVYIGHSDSNTGTNYPQIRIAVPDDSGTWVLQKNEPSPSGEWTTVTVPYNNKFSTLCKDGMLHKFELSLRSQGKADFYVDSIAYVLKGDDGVAPVINYTGSDVVAVALGNSLTLSVTATDEQQGNVPVQYVWEDGVALNENGTPTEVGTYTLTLKAADVFGNTATKELTVNVLGEDTVAPVINLQFARVKTTVGTKPLLEVTATDNSGSCTINTSWSKNALDNRGRLTAGTHIWTITAIDAHDNTTTKSVIFTVTENEPAYADVKDETKSFTVTFDGKNPLDVVPGAKLEKPADPVKEGEGNYKFSGWYVNGKKWNFETDVVTDNLDLQPRWQEITENSGNGGAAQTEEEGGCGSVIGGVASGILALGVAAAVFFKKKED